MRDLLIISIVLFASVVALRQPWVGVLNWVWLSLMNPHRFSWGLAYDAPLAAIAAASTLVGLMATKDRNTPLNSAAAIFLAIFTGWMTLSWLMGISPAEDYEQWKKVMKINLMVFVALMLIRSRTQIVSLAWITALSLGVLGIKGGVFTVINGGNYRVWGPPGTFIEDNNEFALALIMTVPLLQFIRLQSTSKALRVALLASMLLCTAAALGSYSRGGLLALLAMGSIYWWRGTNRFRNGLVIALVGLAMIAFMPDQWGARMSTIDNYSEDASALGRFSAWWTAYGVAKDYPFGAGFEIARPELVARYSPYPGFVHAAHSIYFLVLGNHGFVGLFLFLGIWVSTWRSAAWIRRESAKQADLLWCFQLASMCQVTLLAYAVGGAFLSLSYFDLPYYVMVLIVSTRLWMQGRREEVAEQIPRVRWLATAARAAGIVRT
jgi:probable O-glycosylation ligase (exosortase A-associated)